MSAKFTVVVEGTGHLVQIRNGVCKTDDPVLSEKLTFLAGEVEVPAWEPQRDWVVADYLAKLLAGSVLTKLAEHFGNDPEKIF